MGLLSDLLFGLDNTKQKKSVLGSDYLGEDYDDYYGELYDDALMGDPEAQEELRQEFGDDWDEEY